MITAAAAAAAVTTAAITTLTSNVLICIIFYAVYYLKQSEWPNVSNKHGGSTQKLKQKSTTTAVNLLDENEPMLP